MSRKLLFSTLPLFFILLSWSSDTLDTADEIATANQLIELVNEHRLSIGKPILIRNSTADRLAKGHANYMISIKDVNSDNFETRLETLEQKENAQEISENLGFSISAEKTMDAYLKNSWLKVNVEGNFTHTGIAAKKDAKGNYYYTQIFYR